MAERLAAEMRTVGFDEVWTDRVGNVVGRIGPGSGPRLFYDGHMDTVGVGDPSAWTRDPFGATIENGILYGRGAADMKGSLASLVYGAKALVDSGIRLAGDLVVVGIVQEEPCEGHAMRVLVEEAARADGDAGHRAWALVACLRPRAG
jgi:acetylornithine deacetylase/succinyl-diaminopimelate desuccinylase-like protein